ncbi:MAG: hypothetical protein COA42_00155 [Alteromonadaceae bacterium]|nr:MAG: hypothetical protein COA42_00155 [Alteromonadaceae bacterium]
MRGAGGSGGGLGQFFIGLIMMCSGFYMLLSAIIVRSHFGMGMRLFSVSAGGGYGVTSGMILIPFIFGIGLIFYNARNILGWILTLGSSAALIFGVISSIHFSMRPMTSFELLTILTLAIGGLGLFLRSLKNYERDH